MSTQIKNKDEQIKKKEEKNEMLLDSNPHLLVAKDSLLSISLSRNVISSFHKGIVPQSKVRILRRLPKIGRKVIEYAHVSGQCRQTIIYSI